MIDEVRARGGKLEPTRLSQLLGIPVLGVVGHRGVGMEPLYRLLPEPWTLVDARRRCRPPTDAAAALRLGRRGLPRGRRRASSSPTRERIAIDRVLLHPVAGVAVFGAGHGAALPEHLLLGGAGDGRDRRRASASSRGCRARSLPAGWLTDLWADGVLAGVGSVLVFLPQILILFTFIHLLKDVGYMARAAFVVDRVMGWVGLQGRSFVPLLSCYACAVPGIMATRTIASPRERLATILVAPFMTCSARLPVYTLLIAAFVPARDALRCRRRAGAGDVRAVPAGRGRPRSRSAALLSSTLLRGHAVGVLHGAAAVPLADRRGCSRRQVWRSARAFVKRAGTIILATSIVLWGLLSFPRAEPDPARTPAQEARANLEASAAAQLGHAIEPAIAPLGFDWKIGVGLIASLAAREVIVATLAQIYAVGDADDFDGLRDALRADVDPRTGRPVFTLPVALSLLRVLRVRAAVHVDDRRDGARDRQLALAGARVQLHARRSPGSASFVTYRVASALL